MKNIILLILIFLYINSYSQTIIEMEKQNGIYTVECKINGIPMNFIFDTGASNVSISKTEASFLIKQGLITKDDIIGNINYKIANGDILEGTKINIKEIEIKGIKVNNVTATVVHNLNAPLLLGQSFLSKLGTITIQGNKLIINNSKNIDKNIETIEKISTFSEVFAGSVFIHITKIDYNKSAGIITIRDTNKFGKIIDSSVLTIYIEDIVRKNAKYTLNKFDDGQYSVYLQIPTKNKSVERKDLKFEKGKEYLAITKKIYLNEIRVFANGNTISKYLAEKYLNAWKELLNLKDLKNISPVEKEIDTNLTDKKFNDKKNIIPEFESIGGIKLGSSPKNYPFIIKNKINKNRYKTNEELRRAMYTHYVDLDKFIYNTYANVNIRGIYINTKDNLINEIAIDLNYDKNLLDKLILHLGKPTFLGKGEHPDAFTYWENNLFNYTLGTFYKEEKSHTYHKIILTSND